MVSKPLGTHSIASLQMLGSHMPSDICFNSQNLSTFTGKMVWKENLAGKTSRSGHRQQTSSCLQMRLILYLDLPCHEATLRSIMSDLSTSPPIITS